MTKQENAIEAAVSELPFAVIRDAENNSLLDPIKAKNGTAAIITFAGMGSTPITLYWAIKDQAAPTFEPIVQTGSTSGSVKIDIPWQWVSTCIGKTVQIKYTATVAGRLQESKELELEIKHIREDDLKGSLPVFVHAKYEHSTWKLDMHTFSGDETVRVKAWPMIQKGHRLFVNVAGDQHTPPFEFSWVALDHQVTADEAHPDHVFEFRLSRGWMARRADYSALTAHMAVIFDGSVPRPPAPIPDPIYETRLPENAHEFHPRTTTLLFVDPALDLLAPHLRDSTDCGDERWVVNPVNTVGGAHMVVAYEGMSAGDIVCPTFSGTSGPGSPALECHIVQEGETSLEFRVPPSAISANFCKDVTLSYTVSHSGTGPWMSPPRVVKVLNISGLPTPEVTQATDKVLDLNTFKDDADATVIPYDYRAVGQYCWLWVTGKLENGGDHSFEVLKGELLTEQWLNEGISTLLPRNELQKLADCEPFEVHFAVNFNGQSDQASAGKFPVLTLGIVQEDLVLKAPTVREAVGNQLPVWNGNNGVTVRVEYERISPHHTISVCWKQSDGTCLALESKPGNSNPGYVDFQIPRKAVIHGIGKTVAINYTVTSKCKEATSPGLPLNISIPVRLPAPVVPQATSDGILDLRTFAEDADITVEAWWFILLGQRGWLECKGIKDDGSSYTHKVMISEAIELGDLGGLQRVLKREELEKFLDRSQLLIEFHATPDGRPDLSQAIKFPVLTLEIVQEDLVLKAPTVREAVGNVLNPENAKEGVTVRVAYDRINPGQTIQPYWVRPDGTSPPIEAKPGNSTPGHVDFTVPFKEVIACIGKTVAIRYTVTSKGQQAHSPTIELEVGVPKHWPTPEVPQATDGILDARTFVGDATAKVKPWSPWMQADQRVWLSAQGTAKDDSPYEFKLMVGELVTAQDVSQGLQRILRRAGLESLKNFSTLTLTCKVTTDGGTDVSKAILFPPLALKVRLPFDDVTTFDNNNWNGWGKGPAAADPRDLVIKHENGNWFLYNWTYTERSAGVFLFRNYANLEVGRSYEFSIAIHRVGNVHEIPKVSLLVGGKTLVGPVEIRDQNWHTLKGDFIATAETMLLELFNHVATGMGNDYAVDNVRVREV